MQDLAVLIPVYNDQPGLDRSLASIREPDNSFTVVIVDDGSRIPVAVDPDDYPFEVEVIRLDKNAGIAGALNIGLAHIRTRGFSILARLDAADLNVPNRFRDQYERLREDKDLQLLGANVVFYDEADDRELFTTRLPLSEEKIRRWMVFRNCFIHPAVMIRLEALTGVGGYDDGYRHIEDFVLFSRLVERYPGANLESPLVCCYVREEGISLKNRKEQLLSGLRYQWDHPKPFRLLWYAYMVKRIISLWVPFSARNRMKNLLGFVETPPAPKREVADPLPIGTANQNPHQCQ